MRPLGDIASAMLQHASTPGTVRQVCERAQVGYGAGAYTASRLLTAGLLVRHADAQPPRAGRGRPPMLVMAAPEPDDDSVMLVLQRGFAQHRPAAWEWDAL